MDNKVFSELVTAKIAEFIDTGMKQDEAVAAAFNHVKSMKEDGTVVRISRARGFVYNDKGKPVIRYKTTDELKAAVDRLEGRVLPTYTSHDDHGDITKATGIVYNILFDTKTESIYGEVYPPRPKGTQDSPGFDCIEVETEDGRTIQTDIHLDHVAISSDLVARGGRTASVIDAMVDKPIEPGTPGEDVPAETGDAIPKKEMDAVVAERDALKARLDEYEKAERDSLVKVIEARLKKDHAVISFDALSIDGLRTIKTVVDAIETKGSPKPFFSGDGEKHSTVLRGNM